MKITQLEQSKKNYLAPQISRIILDNEISLQLESSPPSGPDEVSDNLQYQNVNNPINRMLV
jgi:hypothetical protein